MTGNGITVPRSGPADHDNAVDLAVLLDKLVAHVLSRYRRRTRWIQITNVCTTTSATSRRTLSVNKKIDRNIIEIGGTMPAGDAGFREPITFTSGHLSLPS
jgi:hypothetical protein